MAFIPLPCTPGLEIAFWTQKAIFLYRKTEVAITTSWPGDKLSSRIVSKMTGPLFEVKCHLCRT